MQSALARALGVHTRQFALEMNSAAGLFVASSCFVATTLARRKSTKATYMLVPRGAIGGEGGFAREACVPRVRPA